MVRWIVCLFLWLSFPLDPSWGESFFIEGAGRTIHVLCLPVDPPYLIRRPDGELDGFFVDLIKALAETENLRISFRVGGWEDLRQSLHRGRIDVVLGTPHPVPKDREPFSYLQVYNVDPSDFGGENPLSRPLRRVSGKDLGDLCFSVPVVEEPFSCMVKRDSYVKSLRDLKDQSMVVRSGSPALEFLSSGGLTSRMIAVASLEDAMRLVSSGIYPGALMGTYQGLYLREQLGFKNLEYIMPPVFTLERGMVIAKGDAGLAMKLGRAFEGMRQTGAYRRLLSRWFGGYDTTIIDRDLAMKIGAVFVAVLFLIGGWNIILKREVARITREREKILDFTRDGIVAVDREGHVSMINKVAQDLLAVDETVLGLWSEDVIPDVDFSTVLQTGEAVFDVEQNLRGSLVIANKAPVMYRGFVYGAIATFRDMTEIHALAEEITGVRMYVESLRVQNHEFQNKLQAIAGLIQMGRYEKAIEFITNEAKPASSSTSFVSENIKNPAVGGIVIGKVGRCRELGIDFLIDPDSFCNETEGISDQAMVVIIGNLLENGIEAVLASGVENPKLEFAIFDESNRIMISVVDNGGTMTDEIASRMFTKGFSTKTRSRPSGFGLYNVKKLVDAMEGDLSVDYVTGEYTEFMVTLPNGGI
ncbi:transporter substrate-binding domain-containing protein [Dethiosulfovibrio salsuginis]|uniref:Sensor_kinase_SpoOB-type, alpha-helical domain n=1 Tax=Dethiosulfovibrio salsuginis TaxID=561720 RepID=A0A1X7JTC7_9BACT|nr:transporter substrate-binding domain-containing protein [Dethiosulfovibrio salsuginis]SMG31537.1 Sensor_kinase_SpoOB-type, alpha-helical domain [Dethiosulfovibrio salsuginis]